MEAQVSRMLLERMIFIDTYGSLYTCCTNRPRDVHDGHAAPRQRQGSIFHYLHAKASEAPHEGVQEVHTKLLPAEVVRPMVVERPQGLDGCACHRVVGEGPHRLADTDKLGATACHELRLVLQLYEDQRKRLPCVHSRREGGQLRSRQSAGAKSSCNQSLHM
jgi:hypothetical protein